MTITIPDRGSKHRCLNCQTLFYDLKKPKLVCPRCGVDQAEAALAKPATPKRKRKAAKPVAASLAPVSHDDEAPEEKEDDKDEAAAAVEPDDGDDEAEDDDDAPDSD